MFVRTVVAAAAAVRSIGRWNSILEKNRFCTLCLPLTADTTTSFPFSSPPFPTLELKVWIKPFASSPSHPSRYLFPFFFFSFFSLLLATYTRCSHYKCKHGCLSLKLSERINGYWLNTWCLFWLWYLPGIPLKNGQPTIGVMSDSKPF